MYKTIFNKRNSLKFNRFSNKNYSLFAVLGREVLVGALSVATLSHAKAAGVSTEGAKVDSTLYKGGKAYELDAVSVTGSRAPMTVEQSPKIVSVITRDDIHRAAAQTINDVLKLATGVDVRQRGGFGVQTDISINGGTFDQITILLNDVNISNPQTGHNASDFPVALADIDHIEVLEGAASRLFGTSAFNGAINIVTKKAKSEGVLGHQALARAFGAELRQLSAPLHGHPTTLTVTDAGDLLLQKIAPPLIVGRYHSWIVDPDSMPEELIASSHDEAGHIMSFYHRNLPIHGVQFHPESCISNCGPALIRNWLATC